MNPDKCPDKSIKNMGECVFPYYGLAPHKHKIDGRKMVIGGTTFSEPDEWPENFSPDPEDKNCGVYSCPFNESCRK